MYQIPEYYISLVMTNHIHSVSIRKLVSNGLLSMGRNGIPTGKCQKTDYTPFVSLLTFQVGCHCLFKWLMLIRIGLASSMKYNNLPRYLRAI